ncbi:MAG TPA: hypothetical protein VHT21_24725 [Stellaceae bacterium]|nr:hypothetical protein [Stellaceae bacterium]
MASDHLEIAIDQHRNIEAEDLDAVRDLPDLFFAVQAGIGRIRLQRLDPPINNRLENASVMYFPEIAAQLFPTWKTLLHISGHPGSFGVSFDLN